MVVTDITCGLINTMFSAYLLLYIYMMNLCGEKKDLFKHTQQITTVSLQKQTPRDSFFTCLMYLSIYIYICICLIQTKFRRQFGTI